MRSAIARKIASETPWYIKLRIKIRVKFIIIRHKIFASIHKEN